MPVEALAPGAHYDAVLMDVQMPEMDGIEATTRIREQIPADRLPIIAMTAHAYEQERQRCFDAGMNDHVAKPVDPAVLVATLDRWLTPRDGGAVVAEMPVAEARPVVELPDSLPPFDLAAALVRVNGKRALLQADRGFRAEIRGCDPGTAADGRWGCAGSRRAGRGAPAGAHAERRGGGAGNRRGRGGGAGCRGRFGAKPAGRHRRTAGPAGAAMAPALAAARTLDGPAPAAPFKASAGGFDYGAMAPAIAELRVQLLRRNLRARRSFAALEDALGATPAAAWLQPVKEAIGALDYARAAELARHADQPDRCRDGGDDMTKQPMILIIDDEISNIEILSAALEDEHEISFATSGAEALEIAGSVTPDLILLDVLMPGMDGMRFAGASRPTRCWPTCR